MSMFPLTQRMYIQCYLNHDLHMELLQTTWQRCTALALQLIIELQLVVGRLLVEDHHATAALAFPAAAREAVGGALQHLHAQRCIVLAGKVQHSH